jgi:hypothetical protein
MAEKTGLVLSSFETGAIPKRSDAFSNQRISAK